MNRWNGTKVHVWAMRMVRTKIFNPVVMLHIEGYATPA